VKEAGWKWSGLFACIEPSLSWRQVLEAVITKTVVEGPGQGRSGNQYKARAEAITKEPVNPSFFPAPPTFSLI